MGWIIFAISWPIVGVLSMLAATVLLQRGIPYNPHIYDGFIPLILCGMALGYCVPIFIIPLICVDWGSIKEKFTRFMYNLANPDKKGDKE